MTSASSAQQQAPDVDEVFRIYGARVRQQALRLTRDADEADDLTQDVFLRVLRHLPRFDPSMGSLEGWLYRITLNCFLERTRTHRLRRRLAAHLAGRPSPEAGPHELVVGRMIEVDIRVALARLTTDQLHTVLLHDVEGLTYAEVAVRLSVAPGTVGSRLCRSHAILRAALVHRAPRASGHAA